MSSTVLVVKPLTPIYRDDFGTAWKASVSIQSVQNDFNPTLNSNGSISEIETFAFQYDFPLSHNDISQQLTQMTSIESSTYINFGIREISKDSLLISEKSRFPPPPPPSRRPILRSAREDLTKGNSEEGTVSEKDAVGVHDNLEALSVPVSLPKNPSVAYIDALLRSNANGSSVPSFDQKEHSDLFFLVSQTLSQRETLLSDFITLHKPVGQRSPDNLKLMCSVALEFSKAVLRLHEKRIIHGSLSPFTVSVCERNELTVKLRNFGFSAMKSSFLIQSRKKVVEQELRFPIVNNRDYLPPEVFLTNEEQPSVLNESSDVFSFGILLWELFEGGFVHYKPSDVLSCHSSIRRERIRMISQKGIRWTVSPLLLLSPYQFQNTPNEIASLILKCLTDIPSARPSIFEIVEVLSNLNFDKLTLRKECFAAQMKINELAVRGLFNFGVSSVNSLESFLTIGSDPIIAQLLIQQKIVAGVVPQLLSVDIECRDMTVELLYKLSTCAGFSSIFISEGLKVVLEALFSTDIEFVTALLNIISISMTNESHTKEFIKLQGVVILFDLLKIKAIEENLSVISAILHLCVKCLRFEFARSHFVIYGIIRVLQSYASSTNTVLQCHILTCLTLLKNTHGVTISDKSLYDRFFLNLSCNNRNLIINAAKNILYLLKKGFQIDETTRPVLIAKLCTLYNSCAQKGILYATYALNILLISQQQVSVYSPMIIPFVCERLQKELVMPEENTRLLLALLTLSRVFVESQNERVYETLTSLLSISSSVVCEKIISVIRDCTSSNQSVIPKLLFKWKLFVELCSTSHKMASGVLIATATLCMHVAIELSQICKEKFPTVFEVSKKELDIERIQSDLTALSEIPHTRSYSRTLMNIYEFSFVRDPINGVHSPRHQRFVSFHEQSSQSIPQHTALLPFTTLTSLISSNHDSLIALIETALTFFPVSSTFINKKHSSSRMSRVFHSGSFKKNSVATYVTPHPIPRRNSHEKSGLFYANNPVNRILMRKNVDSVSRQKLPKFKQESLFFKKLPLNRDYIHRHELIGSGGSGSSVYSVSCLGLMFVEKVISSDIPVEAYKRFLYEVKVLSLMDHPNIMRYLGHSFTLESLSVFVEFFPSTLANVLSLSTEHFPAIVIGKLCLQIAKGLSFLHSLDPIIIHSDIKSENLFVLFNQQHKIETLKIGDFDSSVMCKPDKFVSVSVTFEDQNFSIEGTETANARGTVGWMAPELFVVGTKRYNEKIDIWSFAMTMFEMIELSQPFFDLPPLEKTKLCKHGFLPVFRNLQMDNQRTLEHESLLAVFQNCTQLDPNARPSALRIVEALNSFVETH